MYYADDDHVLRLGLAFFFYLARLPLALAIASCVNLSVGLNDSRKDVPLLRVSYKHYYGELGRCTSFQAPRLRWICACGILKFYLNEISEKIIFLYNAVSFVRARMHR